MLLKKLVRYEQRTVTLPHNESFDRNVLRKTMADFGLDFSDLNVSERWECTMKLYRAKGYNPAKLDTCCRRKSIRLNHHEALSDARACALLYLDKDNE